MPGCSRLTRTGTEATWPGSQTVPSLAAEAARARCAGRRSAARWTGRHRTARVRRSRRGVVEGRGGPRRRGRSPSRPARRRGPPAGAGDGDRGRCRCRRRQRRRSGSLHWSTPLQSAAVTCWRPPSPYVSKVALATPPGSGTVVDRSARPSRTRGAVLVAETVSGPLTTAPLGRCGDRRRRSGAQQVERPVDVHQAVGEAEPGRVGAADERLGELVGGAAAAGRPAAGQRRRRPAGRSTTCRRPSRSRHRASATTIERPGAARSTHGP